MAYSTCGDRRRELKVLERALETTQRECIDKIVQVIYDSDYIRRIHGVDCIRKSHALRVEYEDAKETYSVGCPLYSAVREKLRNML
jgi:hypothetical protein